VRSRRRGRRSSRLVVIALLAGAAGAGLTTATPSAHAVATPTIPLLTGGILHFEGSSSSSIDETFSDATWYKESMSGLTFSADYLLMGDYAANAGNTPVSNWPGGLMNNQNPPLSWQSTAGTDSSSSSDGTTCSGSLTWGAPDATSFGDRIPGFDRATDDMAGVGRSVVATTGQCASSDGTFEMSGSAQPAASARADLVFPAQPFQATQITRPVAKTVTFANTSGTGGQTETTTGTLTLSCALCVSDITFRQLLDPTNGDQLQVVPNDTTYDGNVIEISATVHNTTDLTLVSPVLLRDASGAAVREAAGTHLLQPVTFPAGSTTTVTESIDTSGMAWAGQAPRPDHPIQVETAFGGAQRALTILPKPVVLVHGWNSDASTWETMKQMLAAKDAQWPVFAVGDSWSEAGETMNTDPVSGSWISGNAAAEDAYIEHVRSMTGAQHVDLVVHSMGGLISRYYIDRLMLGRPHPPGGRPLVSHLVMLGTPNQGSPCAEVIAAPAVIAGGGRPTLQLTTTYIGLLFDHTIVHQNGVPFSVMAGTGIPTCLTLLNGDGVVTKISAWWSYTDVGSTFGDLHTKLPEDQSIVDGWILPHIALSQDRYWTPDGTPRNARVGTRARVAARSTTSSPPAVAAAATRSVAVGATWSLPAYVESGTKNLTATSVAAPGVRIQLVRPNGTVAATQAAGSATASAPFRSLSAGSPAPGRWAIRYTNTGSATASVIAGAVLVGAPTSATATTTTLASHRLLVTARLTKATAAVTGATATAYLRSGTGALVTLKLHDDGLAGDTHAHDGTYSARSGSLTAGGWTIAVRLTKEALTRFVMTAGTA
jgi:pimeloyl-ACP methyl ester carboxylesterase